MINFIKKYKLYVITFLFFFGIAIFLIGKPTFNNKFKIIFFDVGQGDSIFIKTPQNHIILIDSGPGNKLDRKLATEMGFFNKHIDLAILTHPHADHLDGFVSVFEKYDVDNFMISNTSRGDKNYDKLLDIVNRKGINLILADKFTDFKIGDVFIDTIYPFSNNSNDEIPKLNNISIVAKVTYKDKSILLTGDLEKEIEKIIVKSNYDISSEILKVGHHGSKTSSTLPFLQKIMPKTAVIQVGKGNPFGHPNIETLNNLHKAGVSNILRNDILGDISFSF